MKKILTLILVLVVPMVHAAERGGDSPQATAQRYQQAYAQRNIEEIAACFADRERALLIFLNLQAAIEISAVLDGLDESTVMHPSFSIDQIRQDTEKRRTLVAILRRNGVKLGGPPSPDVTTEARVFEHVLTIAGPDPDRTAAELDRYNRRHLGTANPTDQLLKMAPAPEFSDFEIGEFRSTARMGDLNVAFVKANDRWLLSEFVSIKLRLSAQQ